MVQCVRIGHLLHSYSIQTGGSTSPELPLTAVNCSLRHLVSSVNCAASGNPLPGLGAWRTARVLVLLLLKYHLLTG